MKAIRYRRMDVLR